MAFHDVQIYFFFVVVVFPILFLVSRRSFTLVADYLVILVKYIIIIINFTIIVLLCLGQDASLRTVAPILQGNVLFGVYNEMFFPSFGCIFSHMLSRQRPTAYS